MTSGEMATMGATNHLPSTVGGVNTGALYDAQGNLTQIYGTPGLSTTQLTMTYDSLGRVITLGDTANATSQTYGYDDEGLRIKVTDSKTGLVKYNLYDEARHLIAQAEVLPGGSYTWKKDLIYVGDKEVAEVDATGKTWVQFEDHLGSPRFEWDGTSTTTIDGVHLIAQKYAPFGEYLNDPATLAKFAKGFTNHEQTDASGLIYMQARFYAPMYGRFLSPDPARDQHFEQTQSWNIYSYVQNDPTMRIDPTGMFGDQDWRPIDGEPKYKVRYDRAAKADRSQSGGDNDHAHFSKNGKEYNRRVYEDGGQKPHSETKDGINKDVPEEVVDAAKGSKKWSDFFKGDKGGDKKGGEDKKDSDKGKEDKSKQERAAPEPTKFDKVFKFVLGGYPSEYKFENTLLGQGLKALTPPPVTLPGSGANPYGLAPVLPEVMPIPEIPIPPPI